MSADLSERQAFLVLNALPNIGPVTLNRLLAELGGDPRSVFSASARQLENVKGVGAVISATIHAHLFMLNERERSGHCGRPRRETPCAGAPGRTASSA